MRLETDYDNLPPFPPARLAEKLKAIRDRLRLTPDQFAWLVHAKDGAEIESYEERTVWLTHRPTALRSLEATLGREHAINPSDLKAVQNRKSGASAQNHEAIVSKEMPRLRIFVKER